MVANRGIVQSVVETGDIGLETDSSEYASGDAITFYATLYFREGEVADIIRASLDVSEQRQFSVTLPLQYDDFALNDGAGGTVCATVEPSDVSRLEPGGPFTGVFKGIGTNASIKITIVWTPLESPDLAGNYQAIVRVEIDLSPDTPLVYKSNEVAFTIEHKATPTPTITPVATATSTPASIPSPTPTMTATIAIIMCTAYSIRHIPSTRGFPNTPCGLTNSKTTKAEKTNMSCH